MIGTTISHYRIIERIGAGGMGVVYKALDLDLNRIVAIKFLATGGDPSALERFRREARAAASLDHPNICAIYEIAAHDHRPFIVMAFIEGQSIAALLREGLLEPGQAVDYAIQIAQGLGHAHKAGVIHRDIKSDNLVVDKSGMVKMLDFGLARVAGALTITDTSGTVGTVPYMSPEQARGDKVDPRTDLWSLGVVLYEMLTGHRPFEAEFNEALVYSILHQEPEPVSMRRGGVNAETERIVSRAMQKDRERRYRNADEMLADLLGVAAPESLLRVRAGRRYAHRRHATLAAAFATALIALAAAAYLLYPKPARSFHSRDWVIITDFANATGDPRFDDVVEEALAIDLSQSRYVNVFTGARLQQALQRMERNDVRSVSDTLGRELCAREGIAVMLGGRIDRLGSGFRVSTDVINPSSGEVVQTERLAVANEDQLLGTIDRLAERIRRGLGESRPELRQRDEPLAQATTPSLEALRLYTIAKGHLDRGEGMAAIPVVTRAIDLDSTFAMAHALLAVCRANMGETGIAKQASARAMRYRDTVSERERLYIEGEYYRYRSAYREATQSLRLLTDLYPDDFSGHNNLGFLCQYTRNYETALQSLAQAARVRPGSWYVFHNTGLSYAGLRDYDRALAYFDSALVVNPRASWSQIGKGWTLLLRGESDSALASIRRLPLDGGGWEYTRIVNEGLVYWVLGQDEAYLRRLAQELRTGIGARQAWAGANLHMQLGSFYLARGQYQQARAELERIPPKAGQAMSQFYLGVACARSGARDQALLVQARYAERFGRSEDYTEKAMGSLLAGEIALAAGDAASALREFQGAREQHGALYVHEAIARAYLAQGDYPHAAAEYSLIAGAPFATFFEGTPALWPAAELKLGEIYEASGDLAAAIQHTRAYLDLMRGADRSCARVAEARARLARLQATRPS